VGAGALGTLFGYTFAESHDVSYLDVRADLIATIAQDGVTLDDRPAHRVRISADPQDLFGSEMLFVFVRATDTLRALRPFAGKLNPATPIVSFQNGLGNEEAIKTALGGSIALVLGATTESSILIEPGRARSIGDGTTVVGSAGASPQTCRKVAEAMTGSGLRAASVQDIRPHLWGKLIANATLNPLCALLERPNGEIIANANAVELARSIAREAAAVAQALRIPLPFIDPWAYVGEVAAQTAEIRNSMVIDLAAGLPTEIDYINGAIVAAGRRARVPTPYNDAMTRLIKAREASASLRLDGTV